MDNATVCTTQPDLSHLPHDVLRAIIAEYLKKSAPRSEWQKEAGHRKDIVRSLRPLSLTCRNLNDLCGYWIFSNYRLVIEADPDPSIWPRLKATCIEETTPGITNETKSALRWAHFSKKVRYVRELRVQYWGKDAEAFIDNVQSRLVDGLRGADRLYSVKFEITGIRIPFPPVIWDVLNDRKVTKIAIDNLLYSPELQPLPNIEEVKLKWHESSAGFLELFDPVIIKLRRYDEWGQLPDKPPLFRPTSPKLRRIDIKYPTPGIRRPIFDLSQIPQASIKVSVTGYCELKLHIPSTWIGVKNAIRVAFAEGLDGYDVRRSHETIAVVTRPPLVGDDPNVQPNFKPRHQIHLEGRQAEIEEAQRMQAYYRYKESLRGW